jgi:hypothetical protein
MKKFDLNRIALFFTILGGIAAVIALWPIFWPIFHSTPPPPVEQRCDLTGSWHCDASCQTRSSVSFLGGGLYQAANGIEAGPMLPVSNDVTKWHWNTHTGTVNKECNSIKWENGSAWVKGQR